MKSETETESTSLELYNNDNCDSHPSPDLKVMMTGIQHPSPELDSNDDRDLPPSPELDSNDNRDSPQSLSLTVIITETHTPKVLSLTVMMTGTHQRARRTQRGCRRASRPRSQSAPLPWECWW